jgi:7-carboxy-7-deazaguanine synthase
MREELTLPVAEVFGPTIQGEGPAAGRRAWFVRLGGCNLSCSWCDTPYTWDASRYDLRTEIRHLRVDDIAALLPPSVLVVLTGGEPLLQQGREAWRALLARLRSHGCSPHVETNGTIAPDATSVSLVELFVVSPKLANAGPHRGHQHADLHDGWSRVAKGGRAHLKVVCGSPGDVAETRRLADAVGWPLDQVWVMPEGDTPSALGAAWPAIVDAAARHDLNATHRLHVLAWNGKRGH